MSDTFADRSFQSTSERQENASVKDQRQAGAMAAIVNHQGFTTQEIVAGVLAGVMTIGPLFAAFYGRTFG